MNQVLKMQKTAPGRDELIARAKTIAVLMHERAEKCEELRHVPDETIADLIESGFLRIGQPARFGGSELGWDALCEASLEISRGDGSQAWVANIYAEHAYITALFPDQAQHEVWDENPDALISASILPPGNKIERKADGYRLTGRWTFTSGIHHANWILLSDMSVDAEGKPEQRYFLVPQPDVRIHDDWDTIGMVGTASRSLILDDYFVPMHRTLSGRDVVAGTTPGAQVNRASFYRSPVMGFAQLALATVPVGLATGMVEEFKSHIKTRAAGSAFGAVGNELLQEKMSKAAAETRAAALLLKDTSRLNMEKLAAGGSLGEADAALSMRDAAFAVDLAKSAASRLFEAMGGRGIYRTSPFQRMFRDVYSGASHGALNWERNALRYAKSVLT